ncbi:MAG TPA: DUF2510 domain-containing protein [Acidimicrobiia bacterium]
MKSSRTVAALWLTAGLAAGFAAPAGASSEPAGGPSATAESVVLSVGQRVRVQGSGWGGDTSQVVSAVLCGNAALDGAADCDLSATAEGGIHTDGTFFTLFTVPAPPMSCPCLLRVSSPATTADVPIPVTVLGADTAPPHRRVFTNRAVRVDRVHLEGGGPSLAWLGAPARRTLVYRVTNTGDVALHDPPVDLAWGRGANPDGFVAVPAAGDLAVGASRTFRVPIRFPALALGTYRATVHVDPFGTVGTGEARTRLTPWGLVALAAAVPIAAVARLRRALHARRTARLATPLARLGRLASPLARLARLPGPAPAPAATPAPAPVPLPGWYADPLSDTGLRFWNGRNWTGVTRVAPPAGPTAGTPSAPAGEARPAGGAQPPADPLSLVLEDAP